MKYIFDTSAVIYLMEKWRLGGELLEFSESNELAIPARVKEEFLGGSTTDADNALLTKLFLVVPVAIEDSILPYFNFESTDAVIWVISYAFRKRDVCCVIDEGFGRRVCELLEVKYTGSIGIVVAMAKASILSRTELAKLKGKIRNSTFYHKEGLLAELDNAFP